ncbi:hypothetical protein ACM26M_03990 [Kluyvera cryocrescens]|uniref:hypothetical protein n=1 Tax=Kluyvera cryocrescens TaxID=580 RepID=UPI0039F6A344
MKLNLLSGAAITAYLIMCSSLYLWTFWLHFDINILQFIDTGDIIKAAALPTIPMIFLLISNIAMQQYNMMDAQTRTRYEAAGGGFKAFTYAARVYMFGMAAIGITVLCTAVYKIFTGDLPIKYSSFALLLGAAAAFFLMFKTKILEDWGKIRFVVIAFLCYSPTHYMNKGIEDASDIIAGKNTYLLTSNLRCSDNDRDKYRYIATLSEKVFSINLSDSSLCIQRYDFLTLTREKNG